MEKLENVELWDGDQEEPRQVIINTEWGAFGDHGSLEFVRTRYDREIDSASLNPGKQFDPRGVYEEAHSVMVKMDMVGTDEDCESLKLICARVSSRAAHLVSAAVATILNKMKRPHTTVGVDGSVYRFHPRFHALMEAKIAELANPQYKTVTQDAPTALVVSSSRLVFPSISYNGEDGLAEDLPAPRGGYNEDDERDDCGDDFNY
ncbi:hypothetical protein HPB49_017006 [Dermacentor silvarum]|uniref:Uncharacterized protein n=1 Tax=Dermacentor silvarum TaxID=543639 RepID=A0ACB8E1Z1_DERSI|nr:hypothetical protein HPB49_017006 [Dermacentor silvarum]